MKKLRPNYKMPQIILYSVADDIYRNLERYLEDFNALKPGKYTVGFLEGLRGRRDEAMELPDAVALRLKIEQLRIDLKEMRKDCGENFQVLKGYIRDGWGKEFWKIEFGAAGGAAFKKSEKDNWASTLDMNKKMKDFIAKYPTELENGYMPDEFVSKVDEDVEGFALKYGEFIKSKQKGTIRGKKITADNVVYADLQGVQNDAHAVFRSDEAKLGLFMVYDVKRMIARAGHARLSVVLKEKGTNEKVSNGKVTIQSEKGVAQVLVTDDTGEVVFLHLHPDVYNVKIEMEGRAVIHIVKKVGVGKHARMKVMVG